MAPTKVRIETKTVEVERKTDQVDKKSDKHKETVVTQTVKPDGTKETTTKTVEDDKVHTDTNETLTDDKSIDQTKEVTRDGTRTTISFVALNAFHNPGAPSLGLSVSRPVLGPITIQLLGFNNLTFGAGLGLTF